MTDQPMTNPITSPPAAGHLLAAQFRDLVRQWRDHPLRWHLAATAIVHRRRTEIEQQHHDIHFPLVDYAYALESLAD